MGGSPVKPVAFPVTVPIVAVPDTVKSPPTVASPVVSKVPLVLTKSSVRSNSPTVVLLSIVAPFANAITPPVTVKFPPTVALPAQLDCC